MALERIGRIATVAPRMRAAVERLRRSASTTSTILLHGETGTGKELAAEAVHTESTRRRAPLVVVDCGAVPAPLLEAELFGHDRGAYTGALEARIGAFEAADGGTVFLDEIGELDLALQPVLLRALERRQIKRLGARRHTPVNVRIIAATNRDLRAEVAAGRFRADLFYRLAVLEVEIPPMRERLEDLPLLVDELLEYSNASRTRVAPALRRAARGVLREHTWPGNVRELRNHIERCVAFERIEPLRSSSSPAAGGIPCNLVDCSLPLRSARRRWNERLEHDYVARMLARHEGNLSAAARAAEVDRVHLFRLARRHGLRD